MIKKKLLEYIGNLSTGDGTWHASMQRHNSFFLLDDCSRSRKKNWNFIVPSWRRRWWCQQRHIVGRFSVNKFHRRRSTQTKKKPESKRKKKKMKRNRNVVLCAMCVRECRLWRSLFVLVTANRLANVSIPACCRSHSIVRPHSSLPPLPSLSPLLLLLPISTASSFPT